MFSQPQVPISVMCALHQWPLCSSVKALQIFLATVVLSEICANLWSYFSPLTNILKKQTLIWTNKRKHAFETLQTAMSMTLF